MTSVSFKAFAENTKSYLTQAVEHEDIIHVATDKGNAVILSEEEFRGMQETIYLMNSPGMRERVEEARRTSIEECEDFAW